MTSTITTKTASAAAVKRSRETRLRAVDSWLGVWVKDNVEQRLGLIHRHDGEQLYARFADDPDDRPLTLGIRSMDPVLGDEPGRYRAIADEELDRPRRVAIARKLGGDIEPFDLRLVLTVEATGREEEPLRDRCTRLGAGVEAEMLRLCSMLPRVLHASYSSSADLQPIGFSGRRPKEGPPSSRFELCTQVRLNFYGRPAEATLIARSLGERLQRLAVGPLPLLARAPGAGQPARLELLCVRAELVEFGLRISRPELVHMVGKQRLFGV